MAVIRDVGHAYLALSDRNDWTSCVSTLDAAYRTLVRAGDLALLPRVRKDTGISKHSALTTLAGIVQIAERHIKEFDDLESAATALPSALDGYVDGSGRNVLMVLAVSLNSFLCEDNVWKIWLRASPLVN